jgi:hypothetical protein
MRAYTNMICSGTREIENWFRESDKCDGLYKIWFVQGQQNLNDGSGKTVDARGLCEMWLHEPEKLNDGTGKIIDTGAYIKYISFKDQRNWTKDSGKQYIREC